jgi:hypothetical protein
MRLFQALVPADRMVLLWKEVVNPSVVESHERHINNRAILDIPKLCHNSKSALSPSRARESKAGMVTSLVMPVLPVRPTWCLRLCVMRRLQRLTNWDYSVPVTEGPAAAPGPRASGPGCRSPGLGVRVSSTKGRCQWQSRS